MFGILFWFFVIIVIYAYAGYPALLTIVARIKNRQPQTADITPPVTLLIAAYNEETTIAAKLENSLQLDYPRDKLQILVTADGSSDRTPEIVEQFADRGIELNYSPPRKGKMAAINRAMPRATGDIVV
ncbi:MAG: glycosyltransferase, partial [Anaerolineales bacterium]|nr:glycosyltransferase [Anaerolineales bacterium]